MFTSAELAGDLAVEIALGADAASQHLSGEPHLATAAPRLVAVVAAELARVPAAHEAELLLAGAAPGGLAAREEEGARSLQPAPNIACHDRFLGLCLS